jgi:hypothetical protein
MKVSLNSSTKDNLRSEFSNRPIVREQEVGMSAVQWQLAEGFGHVMVLTSFL